MLSLLTKSVNLVPWWLRNHIREIPIVSHIQRVIVNKVLSGKSFIYKINAGPAKGLKFPITLPDDKLIWTGTWEKEVSEKIYSNVRVNQPSYDIGSHRGFMAGIMALAGSSEVYCFEPNPENIDHLTELRNLNSKFALNVFPYAVADENGEAEFSVMPETSMGKLSQSSFQSDVVSNTSITVKVKTLDDLIESGEINPPGFIKVDVEGAELLVLKGAIKTIETYSPSIIVELHSCYLAHKCMCFLKDYGYEVSVIQKDIDLTDESKFRVCHLLALKS